MPSLTSRSVLLRSTLALALLFLLGACGRKHDHVHDDHGHHAHTAPHGGTLVELGDHQFAIEFVRDGDGETLLAYVLDAHAENFVRLPIPGFTVVATVGGRRELLAMAAVGNPATGETIGDTAAFAASAAWLRTAAAFDAEIESIEIRGARFAGVKFRFAPAAAP